MTNKTTNLSKDQIVKEARAALTKKVLDNLNEGPGNFRPGSQAGRKQRGAIRRGQPIVKQSPEAAAAGKASLNLARLKVINSAFAVLILRSLQKVFT